MIVACTMDMAMVDSKTR